MKTFNLDGYIVHKDEKWMYDMFGVSSVTQDDIRNFIEEAFGEEIQINIDCYGGDVWVASDIYAALRAYKGKSVANITGLSASASTVAMLGCKKVVAAPTSQFMMHLASTSAEGNRNDMTAAAERLRVVDESIINAYEIKTGLERSVLDGIMSKTTWMTAQDALKHGFIDEILLKDGEELTEPQITAIMAASSRVYNVTALNPEKMRNLAAKLKETPPKDEEIPPNDNGGESQPVADTDFTQRDQYLKSKLERMEVMLK